MTTLILVFHVFIYITSGECWPDSFIHTISLSLIHRFGFVKKTPITESVMSQTGGVKGNSCVILACNVIPFYTTFLIHFTNTDILGGVCNPYGVAMGMRQL